MAKFSINENNTKSTLLYTLSCILKMLHPLMPYVTDAIYEYLPSNDENIMISTYPEYNKSLIFNEELKYKSNSVEVTEELIQKRTNTVEKEYVKYRVQMNLEGNKEFLSFRDFAKKKYELENVVEPENLDEIIKEEIKGIKK